MRALIHKHVRAKLEAGLRERLSVAEELDRDGVKDLLVESVMKRVSEARVDVSDVVVSIPEMSEDERIVREVMEEPLDTVKIEIKMTLNEPVHYISHVFDIGRTLDGVSVEDHRTKE